MEPGGELSEHCVVGRGGQGRISAALAAADSVMSPRERRDIFLDGRERRRGVTWWLSIKLISCIVI